MSGAACFHAFGRVRTKKKCAISMQIRALSFCVECVCIKGTVYGENNRNLVLFVCVSEYFCIHAPLSPLKFYLLLGRCDGKVFFYQECLRGQGTFIP